MHNYISNSRTAQVTIARTLNDSYFRGIQVSRYVNGVKVPVNFSGLTYVEATWKLNDYSDPIIHLTGNTSGGDIDISRRDYGQFFFRKDVFPLSKPSYQYAFRGTYTPTVHETIERGKHIVGAVDNYTDCETISDGYVIDEITGFTTVGDGFFSFPIYKGENLDADGLYAGRTGDTLYFKGIKAGTGISIDVSDDYLTINSTVSGSSSGGTGGGVSAVYTGASPTNVTVGALAAGTAIANLSLSSIVEMMTVTYLSPAFSSFSVSAQATTVEVGTTLSGSKTFTWSISNGSNVQANSIVIRDNTAASNLATGLANDGSESTTITTIQLNSDGATQSWRGQGTNTNAVGFNSSNFVVTGRYFRFYGPSASSPTNSAQVRALPSSAFHTNGTFTLNTGSSLTKFVVALPPSKTITQVIDTDALNANITSSYVLTGTINVVDAGGTNRSYNIYEMNIGSPYATSHAHSITTA